MESRTHETGHAFLSYVHEDSERVDKIEQALRDAGIPVWRDTADLWPGEDWRARIREAIIDEALVFIAVLSRHSTAKKRSYQNAELRIAVDLLWMVPPGRSWLIPVRLDEVEVPHFDIGGGRTLASLQRIDLFGQQSSRNLDRMVAATRRILDLEPESGSGNGGWAPPTVDELYVFIPEPHVVEVVNHSPNWVRDIALFLQIDNLKESGWSAEEHGVGDLPPGRSKAIRFPVVGGRRVRIPAFQFRDQGGHVWIREYSGETYRVWPWGDVESPVRHIPRPHNEPWWVALEEARREHAVRQHQSSATADYQARARDESPSGDASLNRKRIILLVKVERDGEPPEVLTYWSPGWKAQLFANTSHGSMEIGEKCRAHLSDIFSLAPDAIRIDSRLGKTFTVQKKSEDVAEAEWGVVEYQFWIQPIEVKDLPADLATGHRARDGYEYSFARIAQLKEDERAMRVNGKLINHISREFGGNTLRKVPLSTLAEG